jgi:hypothetical protein
MIASVCSRVAFNVSNLVTTAIPGTASVSFRRTAGLDPQNNSSFVSQQCHMTEVKSPGDPLAVSASNCYRETQRSFDPTASTSAICSTISFCRLLPGLINSSWHNPHWRGHWHLWTVYFNWRIMKREKPAAFCLSILKKRKLSPKLDCSYMLWAA